MVAVDGPSRAEGRTLLADVLDGLPDRPDDPEQRRRTVDVVRAYFHAIDAKDVAGTRALLSDDAVVELPFSESGRVDQGSFRVYRGIEKVLGFWATAFSLEGDSPGLLDAEVTITGDGRVVFIEAYGDVIMTNGRRYRNRYVMRLTVEGDKVMTTREYYNPIISARAFGRDIGSGDDE
jgi:ketosteroid isomerase-like protein